MNCHCRISIGLKFHRWSLFDVKETQTISETGTIPAFDAMKDNPVLVQQGSWTIFEQLPVELAEKESFLPTCSLQ